MTAALLLAGCGGGGGASSDTTQPFVEYTQPPGIPFKDWQAQTAAVCAKYGPLQAAAEDAAAQANPENPAAVIAAGSAIAIQYRAALDAIPAPSARHRDVARLKVLRDDLSTAVAQLYRVSGTADEATMRAATQAVTTAEVERNSLLRELGIAGCVPKKSPY